MKIECVAKPGRACQACTKQKSRCSNSAWGRGARSGASQSSAKGSAPETGPESSTAPKRRRRTITADGGSKKKPRTVREDADELEELKRIALRGAARLEYLLNILRSARQQLNDQLDKAEELLSHVTGRIAMIPDPEDLSTTDEEFGAE